MSKITSQINVNLLKTMEIIFPERKLHYFSYISADCDVLEIFALHYDMIVRCYIFCGYCWNLYL